MVKDGFEVYVPSTPIEPGRRSTTISQAGFGDVERDWAMTLGCRDHLEQA